MQTQQRAIINISMPPAMAKRVEKLAKEENRTKSELLREAFRVYEWDKDWAKIRLWGAETAKRMNIKSDEDVERIAG
ncbi:CopG family transcriptional regulator [Candidatus Microgenomates bacterium]|nr:CopG family transcriptional regulator [Candidatus Microgenomates bacterium]